MFSSKRPNNLHTHIANGRRYERMENERIERVEKDVDYLNKKVQNLEISLAENNVLTRQNIEANKELSHTMHTLEITMTTLANGIENSNRTTSQLAETVTKLNNKISNVEEKLNTVDEKSKVDILSWFKSKWVELVLGGGLAGMLIKLIATLSELPVQQ